MRRLRVIMAFERVGHRLAHGVTGLEATQEAAPVIGYSAAYDPAKSSTTIGYDKVHPIEWGNILSRWECFLCLATSY